MRFHMLGPLEVFDRGRKVTLGGGKQRATLGFLLLNANRVVASSELVNALWPDEEAPLSARKILQNAVWSLRSVLQSNDDRTDGATLLTQAPGYMVRVDPELVDLHRFERLTRIGREQLAAASPGVARASLREAIDLWRGPALADLVEMGIIWPKLTALENARLDAMEDYFDAELACGRHQAILGDIATMVETETLRERFGGQLMLALYRCGRQADALEVYSRVRSALVENLGLEPGPDLQRLQHAILTHDPALALERKPALVSVGAASPAAGALPVQAESGPPLPDPSARHDVRDGRDVHVDGNSNGGAGGDSHGQGPGGAGIPALAWPLLAMAERRDISALAVRIDVLADRRSGGDRVEPVDVDAAEVDEMRSRLAAMTRSGVEWFGGTMAASIGSWSLALFGVPASSDDHTERAVRAAMMLRARVAAAADPAPSLLPPGVRLSFHAAVATGEAVVRYEPDESGTPPSVHGAPIDESQALLSHAEDGEIRVCTSTRRRTASLIAYQGPDGPGTSSHGGGAGWRVQGARDDKLPLRAIPLVDRDTELDLLRGLLERAQRRRQPQLVTILGEPGVGKTRLVAELQRRISGLDEPVRFLGARAQPSCCEHTALTAPAEIVARWCGIGYHDPVEIARAKVTRAVERLFYADDERSWLLSCLEPLVVTEGRGHDDMPARRVLDAWRRFVEAIAVGGSLVLMLDDAHLADDMLLDTIEDLATSGRSLPVLVTVAARPELRERRPTWGTTWGNATTLTLDPLSDSAIDRLIEVLTTAIDTEDTDVRESADRFMATLPDDWRDDPRMPRQYVRMLLAAGSGTEPPSLCPGRRWIAA